MMHQTGQPVSRCRGFTVLELTVAISLMVVIATILAPILHGVQNSWAARQGGSDRVADALALLHHLRQQVVQASRITAVSDPGMTPGYLQFADNTGQEVRYETDAVGDVQFGPLGASAALAGPVIALRFTCYDGNDFTHPVIAPGSIRYVTVEVTFPAATSLSRTDTFTTGAYIRAETRSGPVRADLASAAGVRAD